MLAILSLKSSLVVLPTGQTRKMVHSGFKDIRGFNNVIGAIDDDNNSNNSDDSDDDNDDNNNNYEVSISSSIIISVDLLAKNK
ncbi:9993_t:CDS:2, partial [Funneliformis geosporum]